MANVSLILFVLGHKMIRVSAPGLACLLLLPCPSLPFPAVPAAAPSSMRATTSTAPSARLHGQTQARTREPQRQPQWQSLQLLQRAPLRRRRRRSLWLLLRMQSRLWQHLLLQLQAQLHRALLLQRMPLLLLQLPVPVQLNPALPMQRVDLRPCLSQRPQ